MAKQITKKKKPLSLENETAERLNEIEVLKTETKQTKIYLTHVDYHNCDCYFSVFFISILVNLFVDSLCSV